MYEHYYHEQLAKISTCVKYLTDGYDRYILPFWFWNLNSRDYHGDFLNVMFPQFPNCFLPFPLVFLHVFASVSTVSFGVSRVSLQCSPVSYFRFGDFEYMSFSYCHDNNKQSQGFQHYTRYVPLNLKKRPFDLVLTSLN